MRANSDRPCLVSILRPPPASVEQWLKRAHEAKTDTYAENLVRTIRNIRDILEEAANAVQKKIVITEFDLDKASEKPIASRKRKEHMGESDVLTTVDPSPLDAAFIAAYPHHPLQRTLLVYSTKTDANNSAMLNGVPGTTILGHVTNNREEMLRRVLTLYLSPNRDEAANAYQDHVRSVQALLLYPHNTPTKRVINPNFALPDEEISEKMMSHMRLD